MRERDVEALLTKVVKEAGGLSLKWVSPGCVGVPDRIVFLPGGKVVFAEVKAQGGKLSPQQRRRIKQLRGLGQEVEVVEGHLGVDLFAEKYLEELRGKKGGKKGGKNLGTPLPVPKLEKSGTR